MTDQILNSERKYGLAEITSLANDGNDTGKAGAGLDISFSSSTPNLVDFRSQGLDLVAYEILDHSSQSCLDTTRSQYGLPILFNHNRDIQVGIGENVRIQDGKGRAGIRFGNSVKAQEVSKDVADEIATGVSVNAQYSFKNCTVIPAK